jgi:hypothetical protein
MTKPPLTKLDVLVLEGLARRFGADEHLEIAIGGEYIGWGMVNPAEHIADLASRVEANLSAAEQRRII